MKIFTKKDKISTGVTSLCTSENHVFVGSVDDSFKVLDKSLKTVAKLKINFGTVDVKLKADSHFNRVCCEFFREYCPSF